MLEEKRMTGSVQNRKTKITGNLRDLVLEDAISMCIPGAPMTSIFEGQPLKTRPVPKKKEGHLASRCILYTYINNLYTVYIYIHTWTFEGCLK